MPQVDFRADARKLLVRLQVEAVSNQVRDFGKRDKAPSCRGCDCT
jgi:hypothetical protein